MDDEGKWYVILVILIFIIVFAGVVVERYQKNQCRYHMMAQKYTVEEIEQVCK